MTGRVCTTCCHLMSRDNGMNQHVCCFHDEGWEARDRNVVAIRYPEHEGCDNWHVIETDRKVISYVSPEYVIKELKETQMEEHDKEVYFDKYCKTCAFESTEESEEPCNTCLEYPSNTDSHKPVEYKEK